MYSSFQPLINMRNNAKYGFICVEFFLIIAGYFFYCTIYKYSKYSFKQFAIAKLFRLWPVYATPILINIVVSICTFSDFDASTSFLNLLLLQCTGLSSNYKGITWFVSAFFWINLFYFYYFKNIKHNIANLMLAILIYFSLVLLFNVGFYRKVMFGFISFGMLRVFTFIGVGYFLALFCENKQEDLIRKENSQIKFVLVSLIEIYSIIFLFKNITIGKVGYNTELITIIAFIILLYCFIKQEGFVSIILNNNISLFLGKFSYSIYIMQQSCFNILKATFWKKEEFVYEHIYQTIAISIFFSCLVGVIIYYIIEKPFITYYKKIYKKYTTINH